MLRVWQEGMAEDSRVRWRASLQQVGQTQAQYLQSLLDLLPLLYARLSSTSE